MRLEILRNIFLKDRYFELELAWPSSFKTPLPGQFLHMRIENSCDPFLRRPFSIHDFVTDHKAHPRVIKILYEVVGKGTCLLSEKKAHEEVDCLGPLGSGFDLKTLSSQEKIYIVAGGMGIAPLFFLAKQLVAKSSGRQAAKKIIVLIGARTKNQIMREKELKRMGCEVKIATEDGSKGFKGRVTDLLKSCLTAPRAKRNCAGAPLSAAICACGPKAMLAAISGIAKKNDLLAQVSLEEFMGCGLGACLGCATRTTSGYKRICHDGPVFDAQEIIWKD